MRGVWKRVYQNARKTQEFPLLALYTLYFPFGLGVQPSVFRSFFVFFNHVWVLSHVLLVIMTVDLLSDTNERTNHSGKPTNKLIIIN